MGARLESKLNTQTLISPSSKGMKYLDEPIIFSMKLITFEGNKQCKNEHKCLWVSHNVGYVLEGV